jgi:hypothetical protein
MFSKLKQFPRVEIRIEKTARIYRAVVTLAAMPIRLTPRLPNVDLQPFDNERRSSGCALAKGLRRLVFWSIIKLLEGVHRGELDYYYCNPGQGVSLHHVHPAPASMVSAAVFLNDRRGDLSVLGEFFCVSDFNLENHISGHLFLSFKLTARKM